MVVENGCTHAYRRLRWLCALGLAAVGGSALIAVIIRLSRIIVAKLVKIKNFSHFSLKISKVVNQTAILSFPAFC